jgi:outer membrane protein insertion porin family
MRIRPVQTILRLPDPLALLLVGWVVGALPGAGWAQVPLYLVNDSTSVRGITFRFEDTQTFTAEQLQAQMVLQAPGFGDRLRGVLPLLKPRPHPFDPVTLQRDVIRLRRFYERNGFLRPEIDYPASVLDTTRNTLQVVLTIREGAPLIIQDAGFFDARGREAGYQFQSNPGLRQRWIRLQDRLLADLGDRYTEFKRIQIQDRVLAWLKDQGFAFAEVDATVQIDSTFNTADLRFLVEAGPRGIIDEILVEGNTSVPDRVVVRELPFQRGDRFSNTRLTRGQQALFGLNLFRVALADLPDQPVDSTVTVRLRVREAKLRTVSTQGGYGREEGIRLEAGWQHRNFFGGARLLNASVAVTPGLLASPPNGLETRRSLNATLSLWQPYLFSPRLSVSAAPLYRWQDDPGQELRFREFGVTSTLLTEVLPFRTLSLQHSLTRVIPLEGTQFADTISVYSRNTLSVSGTLGRLNNYLNPRRGFLVRPLAELGTSGVEYRKAALEVAGYVPLTRRVNLTLRLYAGRIWPFGNSRNQQNPQVEFRFDPIRFYAGGAGDVRGWGVSLLGAKLARADTAFVDEGGTARAQNARFEAVGGLAKLTGSLEARFPFPGLGTNWGLAAFLDLGQTSATLLRDAEGRLLRDERGIELVRDNGALSLTAFQVGLGSGLRYQTPVGFLRLDLAFKLNPNDEDLQDPADVALFQAGLTGPPRTRRLQAFNLHLSIGQRF